MILIKNIAKRHYKIGNFFQLTLTQEEYSDLISNPEIATIKAKQLTRDISSIDLAECPTRILKPFVTRLLNSYFVKALNKEEMQKEIDKLRVELSLREKQLKSLEELETINRIKLITY